MSNELQPIQQILPSKYGLTKAAYSECETCEILSLGRTSVSELSKTGELPAVRFGKKKLFTAPDVKELLSLGLLKDADVSPQ
jgi:excisionase family DNA binding protein